MQIQINVWTEVVVFCLCFVVVVEKVLLIKYIRLPILLLNLCLTRLS